MLIPTDFALTSAIVCLVSSVLSINFQSGIFSTWISVSFIRIVALPGCDIMFCIFSNGSQIIPLSVVGMVVLKTRAMRTSTASKVPLASRQRRVTRSFSFNPVWLAMWAPMITGISVLSAFMLSVGNASSCWSARIPFISTEVIRPSG